MNELALFAGAGGGILGGHLLGWRTICAVEWDAYAASVLVHRQNDGCFPSPGFPVWDDVQTFDGRPWRGRIDVISGGFPCQDISSAGKGAGIDGERSGMWGHMARIIGQVRPEFCMVENSPLLVGRGLARVLGDLASLGYDARWGVLGARNAGAPHKRDRIWIVADSDLCRFVEPIDDEERREGVDSRESPGNCCGTSEDVADSHGRQSQVGWENGQMGRIWVPSVNSPSSEGRKMWATEPKLGRVANGVAHRVDRLKCIGNGQVPHCAALAWRILTEDRE
jgi:DNA (cytosine-5)-methyltransferase 1